MQVLGIGKVQIHLDYGSTIMLEKVLFVPSLTHNLLSVSYSAHWFGHWFYIEDNKCSMHSKTVNYCSKDIWKYTIEGTIDYPTNNNAFLGETKL